MKKLTFENTVMNLEFLKEQKVFIDKKNKKNSYIHLIFENNFEFKITYENILKNKKIKTLSHVLENDDFESFMLHYNHKIESMKSYNYVDVDLVNNIYSYLESFIIFKHPKGVKKC